jgi:hypothetical protein
VVGLEADALAALREGDWAPEPRDPAGLAVVAQLPHLLHRAGDRPYQDEAAVSRLRGVWAQNRVLFMPYFAEALLRLPRRTWRAERPPLSFSATGATYSPAADRAARSYLADARQVALAVRAEFVALAEAVDTAVAAIPHHARIVAMKAMAAAVWIVYATGTVLTREPATVAELVTWAQSQSLEANWGDAAGRAATPEADEVVEGAGAGRSSGESRSTVAAGTAPWTKKARREQRRAEALATSNAVTTPAGTKRERPGASEPAPTPAKTPSRP